MMKQIKENLFILFTKEDLRHFVFIFFGILLSGILEVAGIASIAPFMAVLLSPELVNENETLAFLFNITNAESNKEFVIILGFGVIAVLLVSNSYQAFMMWVVTNFSPSQKYFYLGKNYKAETSIALKVSLIAYVFGSEKNL